MKCYIDSSALLKRVFAEAESSELRIFLDEMKSQGSIFLTSKLTSVEVARTLRRASLAGRVDNAQWDVNQTRVLDGVDIIGLDPTILNDARYIGGDGLRALDAIHLATAHKAGADMVIAYDLRLIEACMQAGVMTARPGVTDISLPEGWGWLAGLDDNGTQPPDSIWDDDSIWTVIH